MIHAMRIKDGKATYVSRYVKTARLKQEEYFGGAKFMKIGDLKGFFGLFMVQMQQLRKKFKVLDFTYGFGTANTALIYHHGKLMALSEADRPCKFSTHYGILFMDKYICPVAKATILICIDP
jgi:carotenoid cleavage dioxygenase-like enzyme